MKGNRKRKRREKKRKRFEREPYKRIAGNCCSWGFIQICIQSLATGGRYRQCFLREGLLGSGLEWSLCQQEQETKEVLKFSACSLELLVPFGGVLTNKGPCGQRGQGWYHQLYQRPFCMTHFLYIVH